MIYDITYDFKAWRTSISIRKNRDYVSIKLNISTVNVSGEYFQRFLFSDSHEWTKKRGILPISLCYFVESNIRLRSARKYSI